MAQCSLIPDFPAVGNLSSSDIPAAGGTNRFIADSTPSSDNLEPESACGYYQEEEPTGVATTE